MKLGLEGKKECPLGYYLEIKGMPPQWFSSLEKAKDAERVAFNHKLKSKIHPCESKQNVKSN